MPRRRPECGAARAAGGSGPGGPVRRDRSCKDTGVQERGGKPGLRSEAGSRAADARNATQTRAARSEEGGIRTALHERAAKQETQKGPKAGRTCRRGNCSKAHVPQPQKSPQDRVRMPESQRSPQDRARSRNRRGPAEAAKTARRPLAPEGRPRKERCGAERKPDPGHRPTSARLPPGAQEPHREHRTAQTAPPEKIRARGFTASGSSVRLVRLMRVGESHVSIHKDNSGLR